MTIPGYTAETALGQSVSTYTSHRMALPPQENTIGLAQNCCGQPTGWCGPYDTGWSTCCTSGICACGCYPVSGMPGYYSFCTCL